MPESKSSTRLIEAAQRQASALRLRTAGASLAKIAETLGYASASGAHEAIKAAMDKTVREPADEFRNLQHDRLEALLVGVWSAASKGRLGAVDRALRIIESLTKLHGVDAPQRVRDETPGGWRVRLLEHIDAAEHDPSS